MKWFRPESGESERRGSDAQNSSFAANHSADTKMGGKRWCLLFFLFLFFAAHLFAADLLVYPPVPGLEASAHYKVRVRAVGGEWRSAFAWETACKAGGKKEDAYFDTLAGWTHAYVNFETDGAVEVEIARVNGQAIRSAAVHPRRKASACSVVDGRALVRLDQPCLVAVDIDGQMDAQDTGKGYKGPPIHTVSIFANPLLAGKPHAQLPPVKLDGVPRPVVQVIAETTGEIRYTVRTQGDTFTPRVYAPGKYTIKAGKDKPDTVVAKGVEAG
jgi:hypothetical protein